MSCLIRTATPSQRVVTASVVIPARNAAHTITRQLEALCAQDTDAEFEVIVVDNGSTDATVDVVSRFATQHSGVRLVKGPGRPNRSAARNVGARNAKGAILAFCDADDVVSRGWLQALLNGLERADIVTGGLVRASAERPVASSQSQPYRPTFRGLPCLASGNCAVRRHLYFEVGGFSETMMHRVDTELTCRLYLRGIPVVFEPAATVTYTRRTTVWREVRQHFAWAVAGVKLQRMYGASVPFSYSWRNSIKRWLLLVPILTRALVHRSSTVPSALTAAMLAGQLVGSIRYRRWAI